MITPTDDRKELATNAATATTTLNIEEVSPALINGLCDDIGIVYACQQALNVFKLEFGSGDFVNLIQALQANASRSGCRVEVGCSRGSFGGIDGFGGFDDPGASHGLDMIRERLCGDAADLGRRPPLLGVRKAVEEFMASEFGPLFTGIDLDSGQTLLIKITA